MRAAAVLLLALAARAAAHQHASLTPFEVGQRIEVECKDAAGGWTGGITCSENGERLSVEFGRDSFVYCGWTLKDEDEYQLLRRVLEQKETLECRVPMAADRKFYLPLTLQMWGIVEATHVHVNYHMNFVFHADGGALLGAASYPVRDRFQFARVGTTVNLHGPVRWFSRHSYNSYGEGAGGHRHMPGYVVAVFTILGWVALTFGVSVVGFVAVYQLHLKPRLAKRYLKAD